MSFKTISSTISKEDISNIPHTSILSYYLGITKIPCIINSPLRKDDRPSFGIYTTDGLNVFYKDLSTKEGGSIYTLLKQLWSCTYKEVYSRIYNDKSILINNEFKAKSLILNVKTLNENHSDIDIDIIIRQYQYYDEEYWGEYGVSLEALKYADVYAISHIYLIRDNKRTLYKCEKYAYAFKECKDYKVTYKIYQPLSKKYKWRNKHNSSVISLWTKVPNKGENIIICSSLKDALCVWCNTNIPCISVQGEGYSISNTAIKELKRRYNNIYILFDNDNAGIKCGKTLSQSTGFIYLELPKINNQKDASDIYKSLEDKNQFKELINTVIQNGKKHHS